MTFTIASWTITHHPLSHSHQHPAPTNNNPSEILLASLPLSTLYHHHPIMLQELELTNERSRGVRVALADYTARSLTRLLQENNLNANNDAKRCQIQTMSQAKQRHHRSQTKRRMKRKNEEEDIPFVLERTDVFVEEVEGVGAVLKIYLCAPAATVAADSANTSHSVSQNAGEADDDLHRVNEFKEALSSLLHRLEQHLKSTRCFQHIAVVVVQRQLRTMLRPHSDNTHHHSNNNSNTNNNNQYLNAIAFIANQSILPRKSGRSQQPMSSPPAIPFQSPKSDMLTTVVQVEIGVWWTRFLNKDGSVKNHCEYDDSDESSTTLQIHGMIIPPGVTLIVGGGYHGKSTLLSALSYGIYDKIPHDGREYCIIHPDALSIRAEDGRYVNNVNVLGFIDHLPGGKRGSTMKFCTGDASGSTSQAANVVEGLESGGKVFLVDEDVSAANFMARDGRMRAMIMDEPITPLLYRVNGLYLSKQHNLSTIVVVGGVGEWLDVADAVILMKDYVAYDGLEKARSVSYQFSYNHVQYGGRGVVHRLPWEVKEDIKFNSTDCENGNTIDDESIGITATLSPLRRKPDVDCLKRKFSNVAVHLLDSGSSRLWFYPDENSNNDGMEHDNDEDDGIVDMSKCSQLLGNASEQLYGCGICILWLLRESIHHPNDDIHDLLQRLEALLDDKGMHGLVVSLGNNNHGTTEETSILDMVMSNNAAHDLWEDVGFAYRPRIHEVAMTLTRMRGMRFDILPEKPKAKDDVSEEDEQKKKMAALAEMWSNRRKK